MVGKRSKAGFLRAEVMVLNSLKAIIESVARIIIHMS